MDRESILSEFEPKGMTAAEESSLVREREGGTAFGCLWHQHQRGLKQFIIFDCM